ELSLTLVAGIGDVDSTGPSTGMWELSRLAREGKVAALFDSVPMTELPQRPKASDDPEGAAVTAQLDGFLAGWACRGQSEWEIRAKTWGIDPTPVLSTVDRMRGVPDEESPAAKNAERVAQREEATAQVREALAGDAEALAQFEAALRGAALWLRGRERSRTACAKLIHELRLPGLGRGRRAPAAGALRSPPQFFAGFGDALPKFLERPGDFTEVLEERERVYEDLFDREPPFVVVGRPDPVETWPRRSEKS